MHYPTRFFTSAFIVKTIMILIFKNVFLESMTFSNHNIIYIENLGENFASLLKSVSLNNCTAVSSRNKKNIWNYILWGHIFLYLFRTLNMY